MMARLTAIPLARAVRRVEKRERRHRELFDHGRRVVGKSALHFASNEVRDDHRGSVIRGSVIRGSVIRGSVIRGSVIRGSVTSRRC
jgi:hypothetical protein